MESWYEGSQRLTVNLRHADLQVYLYTDALCTTLQFSTTRIMLFDTKSKQPATPSEDGSQQNITSLLAVHDAFSH